MTDCCCFKDGVQNHGVYKSTFFAIGRRAEFYRLRNKEKGATP